MHIIKILLLVIFSVLLVACANQPTGQDAANNAGQTQQTGYLLFAEPLPASYRAQSQINRYNQILDQAPLKDPERAEFLYRRGILYDSVGLAGLARQDFNKAVELKPDLAAAYNSIGIHFTQQMEFIQAYEMFDSTLEINPEYEFAFLNRGIALYYGGRPKLAVSDMAQFYQGDKRDPYRALWSYIVAREIDQQAALKQLREQRQQLDEANWATGIVDFYLGDINERQLQNRLIEGLENAYQLTHRLCEAYFYLGKYFSAREQKAVASNYFKLALSTNVYEYVEHRYARLELFLLRENKTPDTTR